MLLITGCCHGPFEKYQREKDGVPVQSSERNNISAYIKRDTKY